MISCIFFCLFVSVLANEKLNRTTPRIFYGEPVKIEDYPFYAALHGCGAVILSDVWILTAAHCVESPTKKYVWVGGESLSNSKMLKIAKVIVHQQFNRDFGGIPLNDIALIKLSNPLEFSEKVQPIKLPSTKSSDTKVTFVGRGRDEKNEIPEILKKLDLVRLTPKQCLRYIPTDIDGYNIVKENIKYLSKAIICAKREEDVPSICDGDSGSPLFSDGTLVGLASFVGKNCATNRLGFYVNVASYVPWIKEHTDL